MKKFLTIIGLLWAQYLQADTSPFVKLSVLRFAKEETARAEEGILDINTLGQDEFWHVQGEVLFFPGEFLEPTYYSPDAFEQLIQTKKPLRVKMKFKSYPHPMEDSKVNFGTFVMLVKNQSPRKLVLSIPRYYHPIELSFAAENDKRRLLSLGQLEKDPAKNTNMYSFSTPSPVLTSDGDFYLFAQVSSPAPAGQTNSLNFSSFYLGDEHYLSRVLYTSRYYALGISGCFLILFVFYFFIYIFRVKDTSSLYLSIYSFCSYGLSLLYFVEFPVSAAQVGDIFIVVNVMSVCSLQYYLLDKISFTMSPRTLRILQIFAISTVLGSAIAVPLKLSTLTAAFFFGAFLSSTGLILATIYFGFRHKMSGIPFFLVGTVLNCIFQFSTMMSFIEKANRENGYTILLANFFMAVALALVNAKEFAGTYKKTLDQSRDLEEKNKEITFFNKNLERLVSHKTQEVRSLLDYIPQGVLSIGPRGIIAKDYSAHLMNILNNREIALQSFKTVVLDQCSMSSDVKDQAWQAVLASIDDTDINFDVNEDKFPKELLFQSDGQTKYLKVTWNIEVEDDKVVRILVTLLDITFEKQLEIESEKQKKELILIQELINVPPNKMAQFFSTSQPLLLECESIIAAADKEISSHLILMLFVNAHTVKGSARTLQLKELAKAVHDMEEYYSDILRKGAAIDRDRLKADYEHTRIIFQAYLDINRYKLNRSEDYNKVILERDFIEQHFQILSDLIVTPKAQVNDFLKALREQRQALAMLIFEQLPVVFDSYKDRSKKIAKDIGRAEPHFEFDIEAVSIPPDRKIVLDNCMIHLLRNALDHGIESVEERRKKNKSEGGVITLSARMTDGELRVRLSDDGRGLGIQSLREKGMQQGVLTSSSSLQAVADLIFLSGMSTAQQVSDISGRGVGMNAVKTFVERAGGTIHIKLGDPTDSTGQFYNFIIEMLLPIGKARALAKAS